MRRDNRSLELGCPIRKFPDQSLFAAPRNLSQRTTSFIASQRQGIRQIPFWHLIMLEIRKRRLESPFVNPRLRLPIEKTSFASNTSGSPRGQAKGSRLVLNQAGFARRCSDAHRERRTPREKRHATPHPTRKTGCASSSQCQFRPALTRKTQVRAPPRHEDRLWRRAFQPSRPSTIFKLIFHRMSPPGDL
jgi:hypothetical protein